MTGTHFLWDAWILSRLTSSLLIRGVPEPRVAFTCTHHFRFPFSALRSDGPLLAGLNLVLKTFRLELFCYLFLLLATVFVVSTFNLRHHLDVLSFLPFFIIAGTTSVVFLVVLYGFSLIHKCCLFTARV